MDKRNAGAACHVRDVLIWKSGEMWPTRRRWMETGSADDPAQEDDGGCAKGSDQVCDYDYDNEALAWTRW